MGGNAAILAMVLVVLILLFLIYGGFTFFHWFGPPSSVPVTTPQPGITNQPLPSPLPTK